MSDDIGFRIVCTNCGCLSVRIEEPLTAAREAIVYCGDCGTSRGTMGALRDLAIQRYPDIAFSTPSPVLPAGGYTADDPQAVNEISRSYAELQHLRQQVEIAEWLARQSNRPHAFGRTRKRKARHLAFRRAWHPDGAARVRDERDQKRPR